MINRKKNKLANIEKIATDKNAFLSLKNTNIAIIRIMIQKIKATNKSLGQFKNKHILFFSPTSRKKFIIIIFA